jgi:hypothetical protein
MPEKRSHFKFVMDSKIEVLNKQVLAGMVTRHTYDSLTYANRSLIKLREALVWLNHLHAAERKVIHMGMLSDPTEAIEEAAAREQILSTLAAAEQAILAMRERHSEVAIQLEEEFMPLLHPPLRRSPVRKPKPTPEPVPVVGLVSEVVAGSAPPPPQPVPSPPPPLVVAPAQAAPLASLKLNPRLLAKIRAEREALRKEEAEN